MIIIYFINMYLQIFTNKYKLFNMDFVFFRTTLARWRAAKEQESGDKERRPYLASECTDLGKCEKYRLEIIREISKKVSQIQNGW